VHPTALSAFCLLPTHHSHFKLLKTMKKLFAKSGFTPSVFFTYKGIYAFVFLILTTTLSFSQNSTWEFGVGLRPLNLKDDPYSVIFKKEISRNIKLRLGFSFLYAEGDEKYYYDRFYVDYDTMYSLKFSYTLIDKNLQANCFVGVQYGKHKNNFFWGGATDILLGYQKFGKSMNDFPIFEKQRPKPGEYITYAQFTDNVVFSYGIRQSLILQYEFSQRISISFEASVFYKINCNTFFEYEWGLKVAEKLLPPNTGTKSSWGGMKSNIPTKVTTYNIGFSPISLLSFNYHF
jgi:hypothetical protein